MAETRSQLHAVFLLILACCVLATGCATTTVNMDSTPKATPTPEEQASIRRVGLVIETDPEPAHFNVHGAKSNALTDAAMGFLGGLHPYAWPVGGPLIAAPLFLVQGAACRNALKGIENPERRLEESITRLGLPARLAQHLQEALVAYYRLPTGIIEMLPSASPESSISLAKAKGLDALLELRRPHVGLSEASFLTCAAGLYTSVTASLRRTSDGSLLAEREFGTEWSEISGAPLLFQQVLTDDSVLAEAVDGQLRPIATAIIDWLFGATPPGMAELPPGMAELTIHLHPEYSDYGGVLSFSVDGEQVTSLRQGACDVVLVPPGDHAVVAGLGDTPFFGYRPRRELAISVRAGDRLSLEYLVDKQASDEAFLGFFFNRKKWEDRIYRFTQRPAADDDRCAAGHPPKILRSKEPAGAQHP